MKKEGEEEEFQLDLLCLMVFNLISVKLGIYNL